ncbi:hypothetical protein CAPTEDRAFT_146389, partial [Capitella teleta]
RLNRLPEVKAFIREDVKFFHNVEYKAIPGANPDLFLLNAAGEKVQKFDLSKLNRKECEALLTDLGFYKKISSNEEVPEEFQKGPYALKRDEL